MKNVLVIDSGEEVFRNIQNSLEDSMTKVFHARTIKEGLKAIAREEYALIVMDILISEGESGHAVICEVRRMNPMPILALSESTSTRDKVLALQNGADDILTKPYDLEECMARARALLRRYTELNHIEQRSYALVSHHGLMLDAAKRVVMCNNEVVDLTRKEYDILWLLIRNRRRVLTYEQIYENVWGEQYLGDNAAIFNHIRNLRRKLKDEELIESVHNVGYRLRTPMDN